MSINNYVLVFLFCISLNSGCKKDNKENDVETDTGRIVFQFAHLVDGNPLEFDTMKYVNAAGNPYKINEVMYFISDVILHKSDGTKKIIDDWTDIYYIDTNIPSTFTWNVYDKIPEGKYDSISFTFGINKQKNISGLFVNPPEVNMFWPNILGGGYHYLMINGKWKDDKNIVQNYNFHLGIGQLYKGDSINTDSIYDYVQNYFFVNPENSSFTIEKNSTKEIGLVMNIEKWFNEPNVFDFNIYGWNTMQNQPAMQVMKENGENVFSIGYIK